jgi:cell division protein FtsQ
MIKKILKILTWIMIAAWFVVIMGFVSGEAHKVICNYIEVVLSDSLNNKFITGEDIRSIMEATGIQLQGYPLADINTRDLESELEQNPYVRNAEVSKDISGRLTVLIEQRVPLVRIMPEGKEGYYLDTDGVALPLSERYTPLIILASGNIPYPGNSGKGIERLEEIHRFTSYLASHEFWKDQVEQIYVNREGEYELIPRVGAHHILFGSMDHWDRKLRNLELLYRQGFSRYGWNTYETINLKYANQVICTKR